MKWKYFGKRDNFDKSFLCLNIEVFLFLLSVFEECISYFSLKELFFSFKDDIFSKVLSVALSLLLVKGIS